MRSILAIVLSVLLAPQIGASSTSAPRIDALSTDRDRIGGGAEVVVDGANFTPDLTVVLGDAVVDDVALEDSNRLRFHVPAQQGSGGRTLTLSNCAGAAQRVFHILPVSIDDIADGIITTVAGGTPYVGDGGTATSERVGLIPAGIVVDHAGNIFISDLANNRVRRVDALSGVITTIAGTGRAAYDGDGGPALAASLNAPAGLALDGDGNLLIADWLNNRVRRVDLTTGSISTVVDTVELPYDLALGTDGDIYVSSYLSYYLSDYEDGSLWRVDAASGAPSFIDLGVGSLPGRIGLASDGAGGLYVTIRRFGFVGHYVASTGLVTELDVDAFGSYSDVLPAPDGTLLLCAVDEDRVVRLDPASGTTTPVAGTERVPGFTGDGGPATDALLYSPETLALDANGELLIADAGNRRIRRVDGAGTIGTIAGNGQASAPSDGGPATSAPISCEYIAVDRFGNVFATSGNRVLRIDAASGIVTTVAGNGDRGFSGDGGPATEALLDGPDGIAVDDDGNLYVADHGNQRVRRLDAATGVITTVAGGGDGGDGGPATDANLGYPTAVELDGKGRLFISVNASIRSVNLRTGTIQTLATGPATGSAEIRYLALDRRGRLYASSWSRVVRVSRSGAQVRIVAGGDTAGSAGDGGKARKARVSAYGIAFDGRNDLYLANWSYQQFATDPIDSTIRRVSRATKIITTVAGRTNSLGSFTPDGGPALGAGFSPRGVAFDSRGDLIVADPANGRIRIVKGLGRP